MFKCFTILFIALPLWGSPTPLTSSSKAIAPYWGIFQSPEGFTIDARATSWRVSEIPEGAERADAAFRIQNSEGLLTIRLDESKKARHPKSYLNSWMSLYHRLGFDILGTRTFEQNGETAYVVDMVQTDRSRQARQAIFFRDNQAVIINCHDGKEAFARALTECNKVIRTFRWTKPQALAPQT